MSDKDDQFVLLASTSPQITNNPKNVNDQPGLPWFPLITVVSGDWWRVTALKKAFCQRAAITLPTRPLREIPASWWVWLMVVTPHRTHTHGGLPMNYLVDGLEFLHISPPGCPIRESDETETRLPWETASEMTPSGCKGEAGDAFYWQDERGWDRSCRSLRSCPDAERAPGSPSFN